MPSKIYEKNLQELREKAAILAASNNLPGNEGRAVIEMAQNLGQMVIELQAEVEALKAAASVVVTDDLPGWMRGTVAHYLKTILEREHEEHDD